MTPPPAQDNKPPIMFDANTLPALFGQVEIQISYMTESIKTLGEKIEKAEDARNAQWLEYVKAHTQIVSETTDNTKHLSELEINLNKTAYNLAESIQKTTLENSRAIQNCADSASTSVMELSDKMDEKIGAIETKVSSIDKQVAPLLFVHKILIGVAAFFGTSVGALIWAIITHQIVLGMPK